LKRDYAKISCIVSIIALTLALIASIPVLYNFFSPIRAELTISVDSISPSFPDNTTVSMIIPIKVINYSPKEAHIKDWNLVLSYNGSSYQIPNQNCSYGTTDLLPAQQTEFVYQCDMNASLVSNEVGSGVFTISLIDDLGTLQQQLEFYTPQIIVFHMSGLVVP
jgi:hypothetical protein